MSVTQNIAATSELPGRGIKPLVSLKAHPKIALLLFFVVFLAGLPVVFIKGKPSYSATAMVQVSPSYMKNLRDDGELSFPSNTQYREFFEHQTKSVLRYDIVLDALRSLKAQGDIWRRPDMSERETVNKLQTLIAVRAIPDTYLIEISLQNDKPTGVDEIVNAVVKTYVDRMKTERVFGADIRQRNLETRAEELLKTISENTQQRTALALKLGISTFGEQVENPYDRILSEQRIALNEARKKRFSAEAQLKAFKDTGETDITTRSIQEAVLIDPGLANLKSNLYKRRAELLIQLSGLTAQHPTYSELNSELKGIDKEMDKQVKTLSLKVSSSLLSRYKNSVEQTKQIEANLSQDLVSLEEKGAHFAEIYNQVMSLTHDIAQNRKELDAVQERLNVFASEINSFGFVRMVTPALPPEQPFGISKKKLLIFLLAAALFTALIAPIAIDLLDKRIHTVNDAERVLGIPSLGWMMEKSDGPTILFAEDLLRRMASSLIHEKTLHGTTVFAFSAVKPGAGTSELVLSLGKILTSLGYSTLAIEANAFKPDSRFRIHNHPPMGLAQCLAAEAEITHCISTTSDIYPDRMWVGNTDGARHLNSIGHIDDVITEAKEHYQFVLVDIPPLLLSADAELLAHKLQHLLLVVEAAATSRGELKRAGRLLEKVAPSAVGLVVNRVQPFQGGGYLRESMIEYLTARKSTDYFSQPSWHTTLKMHFVNFSWNPFHYLTQKRKSGKTL